MKKSENFYMSEAIKEAQKVDQFSIPIGAIIVHSITGKIVARAKNINDKRNPLEHAEIQAMKELIEEIGHNYLSDYELYCTVEPCLTCYSVMEKFDINKIVFALENEKFGFTHKITNVNPKLKIVKNIEREQSLILMQTFFKNLRDKKTQAKVSKIL